MKSNEEQFINIVNEYIDDVKQKVAIPLDAITEFFGEERVDCDIETIIADEKDFFYRTYTEANSKEQLIRCLNNCFANDIHITIWFPEVTVTNERDKSIKIRDLYMKVSVTHKGEFSDITGNRTTFPLIQLMGSYIHSHIHPLCINDLQAWHSCCLGTGPLSRTTSSLRYNNPTKELWQLFSYELSQYVTVESLAGGPYRRLEQLGITSYSYLANYDGRYTNNNGFYRLTSFLKWYLPQIDFKINYKDGVYSLGESYIDFIRTTTKRFLEWYNEFSISVEDEYINNVLLSEYIIDGPRIFNINNDRVPNIDRILSHENEEVLKFKGEWKKLVITNKEDVTNEISTEKLLNVSVIDYLLYQILRVINKYYGRE